MSNRKANYSLGEKILLFFSLAYTRLFWKKARLIRKGCRIRGKKAIAYKKGFTLGYNCRIECNGEINNKKLYIGENLIIGDNCHIVANNKVIIGNNVLMASRVFITDTNHGNYKGLDQCSASVSPNERDLSYSDVIIGNNVWIGENVCILPGCTIGDNCVIGAGAIVTKNFDNDCIIAGNPAKIIKKFNYEKGSWEKW